MVSSVCGCNQVRSTKTRVSYLQSIMVVGVSCLELHECCRHWGATVHWGNHECQHILWHDIFQHDNDHCLAKEAEGKGDGLAKHVSRPKPYWASVGHPQTEGGGAQGLWNPPADVVMEEWKRTPLATCEALMNSMPERVKAVLENNGGHTKYWHFGPNLDILTLGCTHFCGQWFRH